MRKIFVLITAAGLFGMLAVSCLNPVLPPKGDGVTSGEGLAVITIAADYSSANLDMIFTKDDTSFQNLLPGLHTDLAVKAHGNGVYILERDGRDNVIKYNAKKMTVEYQENLGNGLNIQDIAVVSETKAYITAYNSSDLIIFDPKAGKRISTIDLTRFNAYAGTDSAETTPFASSLEVYGGYVYVACQRLKIVQKDWGPTPTAADISLIAVIDAATDAVVNAIALTKKNPASMSICLDKMLVSSTGDWDDPSTGGVELIDLSTNTNSGVIAEGSAFGGIVSNVVYVSPDKAYIGVISADFKTEIVPFNPSTGAVGAKINGIGDGFGGLAYDGTNVYAGDRELNAPGVATVNPQTDKIERKITTGMPPSALTVIFGD